MSNPVQSTEHRTIWLQPHCVSDSAEDRLWCQDDVWGACDECGTKSAKYIIASDYDAALARIAELEANERAYEEIVGPMTYREVADRMREMERALTWIVNSPSAHPANMVKVAEDGLQE